MKTAVVFALVAVFCSVNGAPLKERSIFNNLLGTGLGCPLVNCFVDPCMMGSCAAHPEAVCRQGCYCTAKYYVNGMEVTC